MRSGHLSPSYLRQDYDLCNCSSGHPKYHFTTTAHICNVFDDEVVV
jgi:hypothetical protein